MNVLEVAENRLSSFGIEPALWASRGRATAAAENSGPLMEIFLIVFVISVLALALSIVTFSLAIRHDDADDRRRAAEPTRITAPPTSRFFADEPTAATSGPGAASPEGLVRHIERHIRLEHAAAEAFLERPTPQSLHTRTTSPLLDPRKR